jgi:hypothetical protein
MLFKLTQYFSSSLDISCGVLYSLDHAKQCFRKASGISKEFTAQVVMMSAFKGGDQTMQFSIIEATSRAILVIFDL